jgi:hypothetical protein
MTARHVVFLLAAALALPAWTGESTLTRESSLRSSPDGERLAFLTPDTPVETLEQVEGWVRVRIEGWVPAAALESGAAVAPQAPAPADAPVANVAPAATAAGPPVEGLIRVRFGRLKKKTGAGAEVLVVPASVELSAETFSADETARFEAVETELARLEEAEKEARRIENFTESSKAVQAVKRERQLVLAQRGDLLAARHGRRAQAARAAAVARTVSDSKGWFRLASVPPGAYTLYARLARDGDDFEWALPLEVGSGPVQVELDETPARGRLRD